MNMDEQKLKNKKHDFYTQQAMAQRVARASEWGLDFSAAEIKQSTS